MTVSLFGHFQCIQDARGENYWAVVLEPDQAILQAGWSCLGSHGLGEAIESRHARDGADKAHVTVYSVAEWGALLKYKPEKQPHVEAFAGKSVTLEMHGIGKATSKNEEHTAWFGVLTCSSLAELRESLGHKPKDFHVTLAFLPKDVFDSKKDTSTIQFGLDDILAWMPMEGPAP